MPVAIAPLSAKLTDSEGMITNAWLSYLNNIANQAYFTTTPQGFIIKLPDGTVTNRTLETVGGRIVITNPDGVAGNPIIDVGTNIPTSALTYNIGVAGGVDQVLTTKLQDAVSAKDFGMVGDGVTDNTTAFDTAIAYCIANGNKTLYVPRGNYVFLSKPAAIGGGVMIIGEGNKGGDSSYGVRFTKNYVENPFFYFDPFIHFNGSSGTGVGKGGGMANITLYTDYTNGRAAALVLESLSDTLRPEDMFFYNITTAGTPSGTDEPWHAGLYINGSAVTTVGAQGCRNHTFVNCNFTGTQAYSATLVNANNVQFFGGSFVGNTAYPNNLRIGGISPAANDVSRYVTINGSKISTVLYLDYCRECYVNGVIDQPVAITSSAVSCLVTGQVLSDAVTNLSTTSAVYTQTSIHGLAGSIRSLASIKDSNGNNTLSFGTEGITALNYLQIENRIGAPIIRTVSSNANQSMKLVPKGTSPVVILSDGLPLEISNVAQTRGVTLDIISLTGNRTISFPDSSGTLYISGGTDVAVADGGTGASTAATARSNLGITQELIRSQTVTNQSAITFATDLSTSTYDWFEVTILDLLALTDAQDLHMQITEDGGSTWVNTFYQYSFDRQTMGGVTTNWNSGGDTKIILAQSLGTNTQEAFYGKITFFCNGSNFINGTLSGNYNNSVPTAYTLRGGWLRFSPTITGFRLLMASGNISGTVKVYGYKP